MPKRRLASLDIAKCLAISFIIIGHTGLSYPFSVPGGMPGEIVSFSFTFHLPVFFIVGGYFFPSETGLSAELVRKDARRLLLPYAVTSALIVVGCALTAHAHGEGAKLEALKWAEAALWGAGAKSGVALWDVERIGGIWFLLAVFWAHLLIAATYRLDEWQRLLVMCVCTAVAAASARHVWLPLSIQSGMGCALYIYVGMLLRRNDGLEKRLPPLLIPVLAVTWGYAIYRAGGGSLALQEYPLGSFTVLGGDLCCAPRGSVLARYRGPCAAPLPCDAGDRAHHAPHLLHAHPRRRCAPLVGDRRLLLEGDRRGALHLADRARPARCGRSRISGHRLCGAVPAQRLFPVSIGEALELSTERSRLQPVLPRPYPSAYFASTRLSWRHHGSQMSARKATVAAP